MKISRREYNNVIKLNDFKKENAIIATISSSSEEKILSFSSFGDKEITSINLLGNQEERLSLARNFLLPALEANRTILFDNPLTLSRIKSLLDEIKSSVPHEYVDAIAEDIRPILCGFINKGKMMDFWNTETLTFDKSIFPKGMTPEQVISYIKQCASEITDLINAKQDELILTQPKVYISGPISSNADYVSDFAKAEAELRERGFSVINPVTLAQELINNPSLSDEELWKKAMDLDLAALVGQADEMALIEKEGIPSKGVAIEKHVAQEFGINVNPVSSYKRRKTEEQITADELYRLSQRGAVLARALGLIC